MSGKKRLGTWFKQTGFKSQLRCILVGVLLLPTIVSAHSAPKHSLAKQPYQTTVSPLANAYKSTTYFASTLAKSDTIVDSTYLFDNNFDDNSGAYIISLNGLETEQYVSRNTGSAIHLSDRTWLELPSEMHSDIQLDKSLTISVDFYFLDTVEDESVRVLLSNKDWAYDVPGLKISLFNEKTEWQPEGVIFAQFNVGVGTREIAERFFDLPVNEWHTATVDLDFVEGTVSFGINGREVTRSLTESEGGEPVDPSQFISTLSQKPFRLGVHQSPEGEDPEWRNEYDISTGVGTTSNLAEVYLDNLIIQSPKPAGDATLVRSALVKMAEHLTESEALTDVELEQQLITLRQNLDGTDFSDFAVEAKTFIDTHSNINGTVYAIRERNNLDNVVYDNLPAVSRAYVDLGVWMLLGGLTSSNTDSAEGITFIEHTEWPGALPESAQRVENGKADIRAQYVRDPGYLMGGMRLQPDSELAAYLYRPTGFYAPAGETVSITVDEAWVNSGLHIRVGAHADNHMGLSSTSRFPVLNADYRIESTTTNVINPFGGNIYILVPQDTDLGWTEIQVAGAVRAPYFSTREGYETASSDWEVIKQYPGVFADFESDKFMITVPTDQIQDFDQPELLLDRWDDIMDILQTLHGRPFERSRAEAYLLDASQLVIGSFPGGYPVTPGLYAEGENGITNGFYTPFAALNEGSWEEDRGMLVMLHELGHHHYGRFIYEGEQESYVNVPGAAVLNQVYGLSYDEALKYSGYQEFSRTDAAIDWMVTYNFRNGNPMGFDPTTDYQPIETSYQARGHAKYIDLAAIFGGWEVLGDIYETFYLEDLESGNPASTQIGVSHDEFLQKGSAAINCNLASLFHFWGIHPSDEIYAKISQYPACDGALERVIHYLDNAPRTNEELRDFHTDKTAVHENQLKFQIYDQLLPSFDVSYGQQIRDSGAAMLKSYFNLEKDGEPTKPIIQTTSFNYDPVTQNDIHFSWQAAVDPEGKALQYSWVLKHADTQEVLLSRSWLAGTGVSIPAEELRSAMSSYLDSGVSVALTQQVTTSDTFTVVQSDVTSTSFTTLSDSDGDGLSDQEELNLNTNPNNPDSDGDGLSDGEEVNRYGTDPLNQDTDEDGIQDGLDEYPTDALNGRGVTTVDFDSNGLSDIAWRNTTNGDVVFWLFDDSGEVREEFVRTVSDLDWQIQGISPVNSDGQIGMLWRNVETGANRIWVFEDGERTVNVAIDSVTDTRWQVVEVADFNNDGAFDILWRHSDTGSNTLWEVQNLTVVKKNQMPYRRNLDWQVVGSGDLDGDGNRDIVWQNVAAGETSYWLMDVSLVLERGNIANVNPGTWEVDVVDDFDKDGLADLVWRNKSNGNNRVWYLRDNISYEKYLLPAFSSQSWQITSRGDYDGNGYLDLLFRNSESGNNVVFYLGDLGEVTREKIEGEPNLDMQAH